MTSSFFWFFFIVTCQKNHDRKLSFSWEKALIYLKKENMVVHCWNDCTRLNIEKVSERSKKGYVSTYVRRKDWQFIERVVIILDCYCNISQKFREGFSGIFYLSWQMFWVSIIFHMHEEITTWMVTLIISQQITFTAKHKYLFKNKAISAE